MNRLRDGLGHGKVLNFDDQIHLIEYKITFINMLNNLFVSMNERQGLKPRIIHIKIYLNQKSYD